MTYSSKMMDAKNGEVVFMKLWKKAAAVVLAAVMSLTLLTGCSGGGGGGGITADKTTEAKLVSVVQAYADENSVSLSVNAQDTELGYKMLPSVISAWNSDAEGDYYKIFNESMAALNKKGTYYLVKFVAEDEPTPEYLSGLVKEMAPEIVKRVEKAGMTAPKEYGIAVTKNGGKTNENGKYLNYYYVVFVITE